MSETPKKKKLSDESLVWFSSLGLVTGLLMVAGLIAVILWNGVAVFWPKEVVEITVASGSDQGIQGAPKFMGEIVKHQAKSSGPASGPGRVMEWQYFTGNKDLYGQMFKYIDAAAVASTRLPPDAMRLERMEYGPMLGTPLSLSEPGGQTTGADRPEFLPRLKAALREMNRQRSDLRHLEKKEIGEVNARLESLRRKFKALEEKKKPTDDLAKKIAKVQEAYEKLASKSSDLREKQKKAATIQVILATGEKVDLAMANLVDFWFPNRMNVLEKIGHFIAASWAYVSEDPREANTEGGVWPAIFGTFVMTLLMSIVVMPFGVVAAIYLREYAKQGVLVRSVRIAVNNLAGVPSIVFGVFGLGFFVYVLGGTIDQLFFADRLPTPTFGTGGVLWSAMTLALMTVPVVIVSTEEALAAVSRGVREGALACGASKWQTISSVVLPAAAPGILTGLILSMARGAGEVAPLMLVGVVKLAPELLIDGVFPFIHLERKFMHLGFHIYDLGFQSPDSEAAKPMVFATTLLLIALVISLNAGAILIRNHLRKKFATGIF